MKELRFDSNASTHSNSAYPAINRLCIAITSLLPTGFRWMVQSSASGLTGTISLAQLKKAQWMYDEAVSAVLMK